MLINFLDDNKLKLHNRGEAVTCRFANQFLVVFSCQWPRIKQKSGYLTAGPRISYLQGQDKFQAAKCSALPSKVDGQGTRQQADDLMTERRGGKGPHQG